MANRLDSTGLSYLWGKLKALFSQKADNTVFQGASSVSAGEKGLVPAPEAGTINRVLRGSGMWTSLVQDFSQSSSNADIPSTAAVVNYVGTKIVDLVYPVGSIYMSVASTSPSVLFGGTWQRLEDRFLVGASAQSQSYPAGATGGAASASYTPAGTVGNHTLTIDEIPSHSHGLNSHVHSVGKHAHGLNSHTHGAGTYKAASNGSHSHTFNDYWSVSATTKDRQCVSFSSNSSNVGASTNSAGAHEHSISGSSGAASGNTADSTAFNSGQATGNTAANGSGNAHSHGFTGTAATIATVPPYLAVYMWKRTA